MYIVWLTALGVGGATLFGAVLGFVFKNISRRFADVVLSFAAGVMLAASVIGLILPSLEGDGVWTLPISLIGIFLGALSLVLFDRLVPHISDLIAKKDHSAPERKRLESILLFVTAIAVHNLPEGVAAGVAFGTGNTAEALTVAFGIAVQNIPEGMVIIAPMLASGISVPKTVFIAVLTGVIEIVGTLIGYYAVGLSDAILPFALAFAGGTMLFIISDEMIPETHPEGRGRYATFSLLAGFALMLVVSHCF